MSNAENLRAELASLPASTRSTLTQHGFDEARFLELAARLPLALKASNRVQGRVEPPQPQDIGALPAVDSADYRRLKADGERILRAGQCALVVLAGGMATRMGGVVKALVPALPGRSFLELRLAEQRVRESLDGVRPPLWFMTSWATDAAVRGELARHSASAVGVFSQQLSLRLHPSGELFRDDNGEPSWFAPGHGDVVDALRQSGLLSSFVAKGGKLVMLTNLDNLGSTLDPALIGWHLAHGAAVTSEIVDRTEADRGGLPVRVDGQLTVLEELRLPENFDVGRVPVFNINSFLVDAPVLLGAQLDWTYFLVEKTVAGKPAIQFERLLNELCDRLRTRYVHVPRTGAAARFVPIKDYAELAARQSHIREVVEARYTTADASQK